MAGEVVSGSRSFRLCQNASEGTWLPIGFEKRFKSKSGWMDWIGKVGVSGLGLNLLPLRSLEDLLLDAWRMTRPTGQGGQANSSAARILKSFR